MGNRCPKCINVSLYILATCLYVVGSFLQSKLRQKYKVDKHCSESSFIFKNIFFTILGIDFTAAALHFAVITHKKMVIPSYQAKIKSIHSHMGGWLNLRPIFHWSCNHSSIEAMSVSIISLKNRFSLLFIWKHYFLYKEWIFNIESLLKHNINVAAVQVTMV